MRLLTLLIATVCLATAYKGDPAAEDYQKSGPGFCSVIHGIVYECDGTTRKLTEEERQLMQDDAKRRGEEWDDRKSEFDRKLDEKKVSVLWALLICILLYCRVFKRACFKKLLGF
jgi:hypothetical protein